MRSGNADASKYAQRPRVFESEAIQKTAPPPAAIFDPERLKEIEVLRGEGGTYAVQLEGTTIVINLPDGYSLSVQAPKEPRRLQLFAMVPPNARTARSISVLSTSIEEFDELEMEHVRSGTSSRASAAVRIFDGLRELITETANSNRFELTSELSAIASRLYTALALSVPETRPDTGFEPPSVMVDILREFLQKQAEDAQAKGSKGDHSIMMGDIEMIRMMQTNGTSTPELDRRIVLLLKRLEADNAAEADRLGMVDAPRARDVGAVGDAH